MNLETSDVIKARNISGMKVILVLCFRGMEFLALVSNTNCILVVGRRLVIPLSAFVVLLFSTF